MYYSSNFKRKISNKLLTTCPECGCKIINSDFERVCINCGLVIGEIFSDHSYIMSNMIESYNLSNKQYVALGERINFIGGLGTCIDFENSYYLKDKNGNLLPPNSQKLFRRLKKNYSKFIRIKNFETEYRILKILNNVVSYLNLNNIIRNNAAYFYRKIIKSTPRVINNISLIAFCLYYSLRQNNDYVPLSIKEISKIFQIIGHRVTPRLIIRDGIMYKKYLDKKDSSLKSEKYLPRFINEIITHQSLKERLIKKGIKWNLSKYKKELTIMAEFLLKNLNRKQRGGRNPLILAGAIIYCADKILAIKNSQKKILTQKLISSATKIAEYSIRDHYVSLLKPIFLRNNLMKIPK